MQISAATAVFALAGAAQAGLAFSFADPGLGIRPVTNVANGGGAGIGLISYNMAVPISFIVDGSSEPAPFSQTFANAHLQLNLLISPAVTVGGVTTANVAGSFIVTDSGGGMIVRGDSQAGSFVRVGGTNSILFSDQTGFSYTFGASLLALLAPGRTPANPQEAVFTLTNILTAGGAPLFDPITKIFNDFSANSSFTGNTEAVPTPGSLALVGLGGLLVARRRR
ncbi:MAG: hypothetical protein JSS51_00280 [Planctomycetes bacterium]|nr:hypothetical protein [Planctomycetota bacterium]